MPILRLTLLSASAQCSSPFGFPFMRSADRFPTSVLLSWLPVFVMNRHAMFVVVVVDDTSHNVSLDVLCIGTSGSVHDLLFVKLMTAGKSIR